MYFTFVLYVLPVDLHLDFIYYGQKCATFEKIIVLEYLKTFLSLFAWHL